MIKKTLYFGNPAYLYIKEAQLCVDYPDKTLQTRSIPVEDVGIVIIDHQQISLTHFLINSLIDNNAAVLFCNQKHLPNGLILPMAVNSLYTKKLQCQIETTEPLKKQLWRQTIKAKIYNQAEVLKWAGADDGKLRTIHSKVTSGDPENMEGVAAGIYWQHLFQEDQIFKRHRFGPPPNQLFNYGYAILRAIAARRNYC